MLVSFLSFLSGEFLLHIPCSLYFYVGSSSSTSHAVLIFMQGEKTKQKTKQKNTHKNEASRRCVTETVTHRLLAFFFFFFFFKSGEVLSHIPCWFHFSVGSFYYTSRSAFLFPFSVGSFSYRFRAGCIFIWGISLTHPMLALFFLGSFSYTSRAGFIFLWGVSLTRPLLALISCGEFLSHVPCWLLFFIYIFFIIIINLETHAGFIF